jgi:hypothetical protein
LFPLSLLFFHLGHFLFQLHHLLAVHIFFSAKKNIMKDS